MSRHSWNASVAVKQITIFSLYQMIDVDANVTICLKMFCAEGQKL